MGLVGPGFVGMHHIDAVRRLGFVDIVAVADGNEALAREKAAAIGVSKAYGSFEALARDPDIDVIHNTTPNFLHGPVIRAAIAHGKHIISEKPLASSAAEAYELWRAAADAGIVHAVTFNYRGNPLVQQARAMLSRGDIGPVHYVHGGYLQDWLLKPTDFSWRLEPDKGGASSAFADIGSHWCDLAQHITGSAIVEVLADLNTVVATRFRPAVATEAFADAATDSREPFRVTSEDLATILVRFENGARGCATIGQVCAGHKNDLWVEVNAAEASLRWRQEQQNELWVGHRDSANEVLAKDPSLIAPAARPYAHLPGGHQEGWSDAFTNVIRDIYSFIAEGRAPGDRRARRLRPSRTVTGSYASSMPCSRAIATVARGRRCRRSKWLEESFETRSVHAGVRRSRRQADAREGAGAGESPGAGDWHRRVARQRASRHGMSAW
jgi:predicted dehydrogenase